MVGDGRKVGETLEAKIMEIAQTVSSFSTVGSSDDVSVEKGLLVDKRTINARLEILETSPLGGTTLLLEERSGFWNLLLAWRIWRVEYDS